MNELSHTEGGVKEAIQSPYYWIESKMLESVPPFMWDFDATQIGPVCDGVFSKVSSIIKGSQ